jgi:hypothetical protein
LGLAGKWPDSAWALRNGAGQTHVFRLAGNSWRHARKLAPGRAFLGAWPGGGALLVAPREHAATAYELVALGSGAVLPKPASPATGACKTALVEPAVFASVAAGFAAVLGRVCGEATPRLVVERFRAGAAPSELLDVPAGLSASVLAIGSDGGLALAGLRDGAFTIALRRSTSWDELTGPPGTPLALALGPGDEIWAVTEQLPHHFVACEAAAPKQASNLWRRSADTWLNVPLPASAGLARHVVLRDANDAWVSTERRLLRSRPTGTLALWSKARFCPMPVTHAKPYRYGPPPRGRVPVEHLGLPSGSDCPHFLLLDETREPRSPVFDEVLAELRRSGPLRQGLVAAEAKYDRALAGDGALGSPSPWITYEADRYYWGLRVDPLSPRDDVRLAAWLRQHFPQHLREVCAFPYPIRFAPATKTSAATAPR